MFFEAGLISSYTIVTSQPPNVGKLVNVQIEELSSLLTLGSGNSIKKQATEPIYNTNEVAAALTTKAGLSGVNLQSLSAQVSSTKNTVIPVNLTVMGYQYASSGNISQTEAGASGQVIINANDTYSVTATANATLVNGELDIDVNSIQILSSQRLYGSSSNVT